ncbi:hypothetical protein RvY_08227-1 [Ramazzottius varieornatus]|uniref:Uncharacterized protein n=1 Tax=Ramazzottius varieornatus TaxID=947166 RepID=A0A1D1V533_RAMVA|nr:hypothetical protein RvY_08227-1 [Ramazzottius varieornatus]
MDASGKLPPRDGLMDFVRVRPTTTNSARLEYDPNNPHNNEYETSDQRNPTVKSDWDFAETANVAVRRLELDKISKLAKPQALQALEEYNRKQQQWIVFPKYKAGFFRTHEAEFYEYRRDPNTLFDGWYVREYWYNPLANIRFYDDWIEPAESGFGFCRRGKNGKF